MRRLEKLAKIFWQTLITSISFSVVLSTAWIMLVRVLFYYYSSEAAQSSKSSKISFNLKDKLEHWTKLSSEPYLAFFSVSRVSRKVFRLWKFLKKNKIWTKRTGEESSTRTIPLNFQSLSLWHYQLQFFILTHPIWNSEMNEWRQCREEIELIWIYLCWIWNLTDWTLFCDLNSKFIKKH